MDSKKRTERVRIRKVLEYLFRNRAELTKDNPLPVLFRGDKKASVEITRDALHYQDLVNKNHYYRIHRFPLTNQYYVFFPNQLKIKTLESLFPDISAKRLIGHYRRLEERGFVYN